MTWSFVNLAMLWGLLGVSIPVIIHLLNQRRVTTIDWGAMQFLELGRRTRQRFRITEWLLMLARMALLALVALALARPLWKGPTAAGSGVGAIGAERRDVVLIVDGSDSMDRRGGGTTPRERALAWARQFVGRLAPGSSVAVLIAKDRVWPLIDPPSFDRIKVEAALAHAPAARGSSDLPAALAEAFRILERTRNSGRDVVVLTDGQRFAWRPGEPARWALLRDLHRRLPVPPRIWSIAFGVAPPRTPNGSVAPLELSRGLVAPGLPITIKTTVANAGPGPLTRTAELLIDGQVEPGSAQAAGPVPAGGKTPLTFRAVLQTHGSHVVSVRLSGDDPLPADDEANSPIEVTDALPVLLVDGEPSPEPLGNETDFLRAALSPAGADTPQVQANVVNVDAFNASILKGQRVLVLANVARLGPEQSAAIASFLGDGGGVLIAPGDRTDADFARVLLDKDGNGWLPARLGELKGDFQRREVVAHPAPRTFQGTVLSPFGRGEAPPLARADLFAYWLLAPAPGASVAARLDTGDPWIVERRYRRGRVAILAGPIDAEGGTLPVNPDFVPWAHELIFHLADAGTGPIRPGEPIVLDLAESPPPRIATLPVRTPSGESSRALVVRSEGQSQARFDETSEPGVYRLTLPDPPGGFAHVAVAGDPREADLTPLEPAETTPLGEGWPLEFESDPSRLSGRLFAVERAGPSEVWRFLILASLAGLCLEVFLTRRLTRGRGIADRTET